MKLHWKIFISLLAGLIVGLFYQYRPVTITALSPNKLYVSEELENYKNVTVEYSDKGFCLMTGAM